MIDVMFNYPYCCYRTKAIRFRCNCHARVYPKKVGRLKNILVIRLGALGDLVFCFKAFSDIRRAHPDAKIALLVRGQFADFARAMPWFDKIIIDNHPSFTEMGEWLRQRKEIKNFAPDIVYDLQGKRRQSILYALLGGSLGVAWSGAAPFCKYPRPWPPKPDMSFANFLAAQLRAAKVPDMGKPDTGWLDAPTDKFNLTEKFVVLIPGCSPNAAHKRWPSASYAKLARLFENDGIKCVVVGADADRDAIEDIKSDAPNVIDLCGKTTLFELAGIARKSLGCVGNDTGPTHISASVGATTLALFCGRSNTKWSAPPGDNSLVLQKENLGDLDVHDVFRAFAALRK